MGQMANELAVWFTDRNWFSLANPTTWERICQSSAHLPGLFLYAREPIDLVELPQG